MKYVCYIVVLPTWLVGVLDCDKWLPKWYAGPGAKYPGVMPEIIIKKEKNIKSKIQICLVVFILK